MPLLIPSGDSIGPAVLGGAAGAAQGIALANRGNLDRDHDFSLSRYRAQLETDQRASFANLQREVREREEATARARRTVEADEFAKIAKKRLPEEHHEMLGLALLGYIETGQLPQGHILDRIPEFMKPKDKADFEKKTADKNLVDAKTQEVLNKTGAAARREQFFDTFIKPHTRDLDPGLVESARLHTIEKGVPPAAFLKQQAGETPDAFARRIEGARQFDARMAETSEQNQHKRAMDERGMRVREGGLELQKAREQRIERVAIWAQQNKNKLTEGDRLAIEAESRALQAARENFNSFLIDENELFEAENRYFKLVNQVQQRTGGSIHLSPPGQPSPRTAPAGSPVSTAESPDSSSIAGGFFRWLYGSPTAPAAAAAAPARSEPPYIPPGTPAPTAPAPRPKTAVDSLQEYAIGGETFRLTPEQAEIVRSESKRRGIARPSDPAAAALVRELFSRE